MEQPRIDLPFDPEEGWETRIIAPTKPKRPWFGIAFMVLLLVVGLATLWAWLAAGPYILDGPAPTEPMKVAMQEVPLEDLYLNLYDEFPFAFSPDYVSKYSDDEITEFFDPAQIPDSHFDDPLWGYFDVDVTTAPTEKETIEDYGIRLMVLAKSGPDAKKYDRLYVDANGDRDLTNDPVLKLVGESSWKEGPLSYLNRFEPIQLEFIASGQSEPMTIIPYIAQGSGKGQPGIAVTLVPARVRMGQTKLHGIDYTVIAGPLRNVFGPYDSKNMAVQMRPTHWNLFTARNKLLRSTGQWWTMGESFVRFSLTPGGDQLSLDLYDGPLGTFQLTNTKNLQLTIDQMAMNFNGIPLVLNNRLQKKLASTGARLPVGEYEVIRIAGNIEGQSMSLRLPWRSPGLFISEEPDESDTHQEKPADDLHNARLVQVEENQTTELDLLRNPELHVYLTGSSIEGDVNGDKVAPGDQVSIDVDLMVGSPGQYTLSLDNLPRPEISITDQDGKAVAMDTLEYG